MAVTDLTDETFADAIANAEMAVVDFYAGWCGQCRLFMPKFKRMSDKYPNVQFFKVNGETAPAARKTREIPALPYFAVYKNGEFVDGKTTAKLDAFQALLKDGLGQEPAE